ncbi:Chlorovirus glycoprotein repeat domain-containing protein [Acanthocystis turfacea Chlorella virus TN603.4.2]|nr:Chlorovirus glycoprotein repeat domain-containing protein [Acanthocystis turfacea Chlorella virus TN603.4.2]
MYTSAQFKKDILKYAGINFDTGDVTVANKLTVVSNTSVIGNYSGMPAVSRSDVNGNLIGNSIEVSGNVTCNYLFGDGSVLTGITNGPLPPIITTDVTGNIAGNYLTTTNYVSTGGFFIGNGSLISNIVTTLPRQANADILRGNILAYGNVDASNVTAKLLLAYADTIITGQVKVSGNVSSLYLMGNGSTLEGVLGSLPAKANINIAGNVVALGNVIAANITGNTISIGGLTTVQGSILALGNITSTSFVGDGSKLTGVFGSTLSRDVIGNVIAPGNIIANVFYGNGFLLDLPGSTIQPQGTVANQAARLALKAGIGTIVTQQDTNQQYMLTSLPASINSNWLLFSGTNFPVSSLFGRFGDVVIISGTDIQDIQGQSLAGTGDVTSASIDIVGTVTSPANITMESSNIFSLSSTGNVYVTGQVQASGNVTGVYFFGNAVNITDAVYTLPGKANIDIVGNVYSPANVLASNVTANTISLTSNLMVNGQVNMIGNIVAPYFYGNGSQLYDAAPTFLSNSYVNIRGNVGAPGNITTANLVVNLLRVSGNIILEANANVIANVTANYFIGIASTLSTPNATVARGQIMNIFGNVNAPANVDAVNMTAPLFRTGNLLGFQYFQIGGNISTGNAFYGDGSLLTSTGATLARGQVMNIIGNVSSKANVDTVGGNVITNILTVFAAGNLIARGQVNVSGNISGSYFVGNGLYLTNVPSTVSGGQVINISGNVRALSGNVNSANLVANSLIVTGNANILGQLTSLGNVVIQGGTSGTFVGNGAFLHGLRPTGIQNIDITGNVSSSGGNVDTANVVVSNTLTVNGNTNILGQVNASTANVVANMFYGDGSRVTNLPACTAPTSICFVYPSSGFTSNSNCFDYAPSTGWTFTLTPNVTSTIAIQTFSLPLNPGQPFSGLPSSIVTQNVSQQWVNTNGIWTANVTLRPNAEFSLTSMNMGFSSSFGTYLGNSSNTVMSSLSTQNTLGVMPMTTANLNAINILASYISPTSGRVSLCFNGRGGSFLGNTWVSNALYYAITDKNFSSVITSNEITSATTRTVNQPNKISGYFANETILYVGVPTDGTGVANVPTFYGDPIQVDNANVISFIAAKLDTGAQRLTWATSLSSNISFRNTFLQMSLSPDNNKVLLTGQLNTGANIIGIRSQTTGNVNTFSDRRLLTPSGANYYHGIAAVLDTTTGTEINSTMQDMVANVDPGAGPAPMDLRSYSCGWSEDSNIAYFTLGSSEPNAAPYVWKTYAGSNVWTQRAFLATGGNAQFNNTLYWMMRVPTNAPNTGAWVANVIAMGNVIAPSYQLRPGTLCYAGDGNVWLAASVYKNTAYTGNNTFTFAGNTITTPTINTSSLGFIGLWKFQDSNGSYTSLTLLSNSSEVSNTAKYASCSSAQSISAGRYTPKGVGVMRFHAIANTSNIVLNGTYCSGLTNPSNLQLISFDVYPNLFVNGFAAIPSNIFWANSIAGTRIYVGNAADYNYSQHLNIANVAKLNIDGIV